MLSSRTHRRAFLLSCLALAGCGFAPALLPRRGSESAVLRGAFDIDAPGDKNAFDLVQQLDLRLGLPTDPQYGLSYVITTRRDGVGTTPEQEIIRYNIYGRADFQLRDLETDSVLTSGTVDGFTGYSVGSVDVLATPPSTGATIATFAAERDAYARLMVILGDRIADQLLATSADWLG